jgi:hypothetical protein
MKQVTSDYSHWAKKFDEVKHIYAEHGTLCGSVAHCLGNNYATSDMEVCSKCFHIKTTNEAIKNGEL